MKIGGMAHRNGITFFCDAFKLKAIRKKNRIDYQIKWILPPKWLRKLEKKPVLGVFTTIYYQWLVFDFKVKLLFGLMTILYFAEPLIPMAYYPQLNKGQVLGIIVLLIIVSHKHLIRLLRYHGAEHKVINCYLKYGYLEEGLVKKSSRFNKRCGTNLVVIFLILYGLLQFFNVESLSIILILFFIAVFVARRAAMMNNEIFFHLFNIFQWVTVWEPGDEEINVAIQGFSRLYKGYIAYQTEMLNKRV
ncbi:Protein of unknown function [Alkaliphilus peptidifermentans DSM 18978]|uniref:DUF1385 domain-containing protein n=1 Tax=Alkaliphilus peptidifermentans DSM 18978 TaxID=1120976 RepID=A0A1G5HZ37_9FIRM|nr:Protein of unknown function [Alkaliphilus peptidifermentans DSM 18978]